MTLARTIALSTIAALACLLLAARAPEAAERLPEQLDGVGVQERLGRQIDLDLTFVDHRGERVSLRSFLFDDRPVLLTLNYYRCRMLCNLQLNALTKGLRELGWRLGENFRVVTISINPREDAQLAQQKRAAHLGALGQPKGDWQFLVGEQASIDAIAKAVGFRYRYLPEEDQYAHPAVVFFLSPEGKLSRYIYGIDYAPRQIKLALMEASEGRVGSTLDRVILSCFHYDATRGKYGPFAFGIMRLAAIVTLLLLGTTLFVFWRRERRQRSHDEPKQPERT